MKLTNKHNTTYYIMTEYVILPSCLSRCCPFIFFQWKYYERWKDIQCFVSETEDYVPSMLPLISPPTSHIDGELFSLFGFFGKIGKKPSFAASGT